jgi:uncharacterized coiled-coil DUF342 family protein
VPSCSNMTEHIQQSIGLIREKVTSLHGQVQHERVQNEALKAEITLLANQLVALKEENDQLLTSVDQLNSALAAAKSQVVESVPSSRRSDEQIDELVREIEYCISQLKK